jgi:hypothetical protein
MPADLTDAAERSAPVLKRWKTCTAMSVVWPNQRLKAFCRYDDGPFPHRFHSELLRPPTVGSDRVLDGIYNEN